MNTWSYLHAFPKSAKMEGKELKKKKNVHKDKGNKRGEQQTRDVNKFGGHVADEVVRTGITE